MNIYEWLQVLLMVWCATILVLICWNLTHGKTAWAHKVIQIFVLLTCFGLLNQIAYSVDILSDHAVPKKWPIWALKDIGIGLLFLMDIFKPSVYVTGEKHE